MASWTTSRSIERSKAGGGSQGGGELWQSEGDVVWFCSPKVLREVDSSIPIVLAGSSAVAGSLCKKHEAKKVPVSTRCFGGPKAFLNFCNFSQVPGNHDIGQAWLYVSQSSVARKNPTISQPLESLGSNSK